MRPEKIAAFKLKWSGRRGVVLWLLYALIIAGSIYRAYYIIDYNPIDYVFSDTERHWVQGSEELFRDDPFILGDPVMYQLYIGMLAKISLKIPAIIAYFTILMSVLMPWFWYRFFRELQPSKMVAVAGWAVITWLPSWISIYGYFMTETLMLPLLGLALWATWRCKRKRTVNSFLLMVLFWTLAGLTRGPAIPMAAVAAAWLWLTQDQKFKKAAYGMVLISLFLWPLGMRNLEKVHMFAPLGIPELNEIYARSGNAEINIEYTRQGAVWYFGFWSPAIGAQPFAPFSDWQSKRSGLVKVYIDVEKGRADWDAALKEHRPSLGKYLSLVSEDLILLFFTESWPDSDRERTLGEINYQMRWVWVPLTLIVLLWTALRWRSQRGCDSLLLPSIMLAWFIVQGLMLFAPNEGRYRKPYEGLLIAQIVALAGTCRRQGEQADEDRRQGADRRQGGDRRQGERRAR